MTRLDDRGDRTLVKLRNQMHRSMLAWFVLCASLSVALRLPFMTVPLGTDEGGYAFVARAWASTHGSMYGAFWLDRSPLLVLLYRLGILGGDIGVRLLGMVAAILLVVGAMVIAHRIAGARAARIAGLITAFMTSTVVLGGVFTNNELLATVPVTFSIVALVIARDSDRPRLLLFTAGLAASCAFLIKQSFADALAAGAVFLLVSWVIRGRSGFRASWAISWAAGALAPLVATLAWIDLYSVGIKHFVYAIIGFRADSLATLQLSPRTSTYMLVHTGLPIAIASGCLLLLPWAASWLVGRRTDPQLVLPLAAWLIVGVVGITGGGNYFPHYFIQPVAALAVLTGCALSVSSRRWLVMATAGTLVVLAIVNVAAGTALKRVDPPQQRTLAVSDFLRANSRPGDSLYVLYARANLLYYADLRVPYPYSWSQMVRTLPDAETQLRTLLRSPTLRPTWLVEWQQPTEFGLDRTGETRRLIASGYVPARQICGKRILIRKDLASRPLKATNTGPCARLDLPQKLVDFPRGPESRSDSADYIWP